ncbi:MAG: FMN-binding protein [Nitrospirota bacterium]
MKRSIIVLLFLLFLLWAAPLSGKVYLTKDDALKQAFPSADAIERQNLFLMDEDLKHIEALSKVKVESRLFTYYKAVSKEGIIGYAVIGSHIVRTKPEVYIIVIRPEGELGYVEILAFYEPEEYLPPRRWLAQFIGKRLTEGLWIKRDIQAITGATLSAYGLTREIRQVLAIFELKIMKEKR